MLVGNALLFPHVARIKILAPIVYFFYFSILTIFVLNNGLKTLIDFPGMILLIVPYFLITLNSPVTGLAILLLFYLSRLKSITISSGTSFSLTMLAELCLLAALVFRFLLTRKVLRFRTVIPFLTIIYLGFYFVASLWRSGLAQKGEGIKTLALLSFVLIWIIAFVDSREKIIGFLRSFIILEMMYFGGALYSILRYGSQSLALRTSVEQGYLENAIDVNSLAVSVLMFLPLIYFLLTLRQAGVWRYLAWLSLVLSLATTVITFSRNGFVNMMVVLSLIFFHRVRSSRILVFILILVLIAVIAPSSYWNRISTITSLEVESGLRTKISHIQRGLDIVIHNPLFGIGLGKLTRAVHNTVLQIAVEVGLLGLFVFLAILYFAGRETLRAQQPINNMPREAWFNLPRLLFVSLVAYLIGGLSISLPRYLPFIIILGLIIAMKGINSSEALTLEEKG